MPIDITGLACHTLPMPCTWCGNPAVELALTRESDETTETGAHLLYTCRACDPDAFTEPDTEILTGDPIDRHETVRLFEPAPNQIPGQLEL
jgi:hypothetical protein